MLKNLLEKLEDIKLTIIGTGPEEQSMKKLSKELNVWNYVEFRGRITNEELSEIVSTSWLNIHSSVTEGWGYSILEASASGTPTVAFNVPGVRDVIEDEMNGIKVKDGDRKALLDAAFRILNNPKRWWSSSFEVAKKYSWENNCEMWETLIQEFASSA